MPTPAAPAASSRPERRLLWPVVYAVFRLPAVCLARKRARGVFKNGEGRVMANQDIPSEGAPIENGIEPAAENGTPARRRSRPVRFRCVICGKEKPARDIARLDVVRPSLLDRIKETHPELPAEGFICIDDLDRFRSGYVSELLRSERGELTRLEQDVVQSLADHETLAEKIGRASCR